MILSDDVAQREDTLQVVEKIMDWRQYARSTRSSYMLWIGKYLTYHLPYGDPKTCDYPPIQKFIASLQKEKPLSYSSYNILLSSLTFLYEQVYQMQKRRELFLRQKPPCEIIPAMSEKTILIIINKLPCHYNRLAKIILYTGITSVEATTIKWEDIDLKKREITIRERTLPLTQQALDVLKWCHKGKWVFPSVRDSSARINPCLDVSGFNRALNKSSRACGLNPKQCINARSIRNLYAFLELKKGVHPMKVQANLGTFNRNVIFMHMDLKASPADD